REELVSAAIERLAAILRDYRAQLPSLLVVSLLPQIFPRELGLIDPMAADSEAGFFASAKGRIAAALRERWTSTIFADLDEVAADVGRARVFDRGVCFSSRVPL